MSDNLKKTSVGVTGESGVTDRADVDRRRRFLVATTAAVGLAGVAAATWPFLASWKPSARARAAGAPVRFNLSLLEPGQLVTLSWQGKPVWVLRRTPKMLERMEHAHWLERLADPTSQVATQQPAYAQNPTRSIQPEYLVVIAICTHLGCVPMFRPEPRASELGADWMGGFYCPCHGSKFDLAGRVFKAVPAPTNLIIPPHRYVDANTVEIGTEGPIAPS